MSEPFDPSRGLSTGEAKPDSSKTTFDALTNKSKPTFMKGVVLEVLSDPTARNDDFFEKVEPPEEEEEPAEKSFANIEELPIAPRNSLIVIPSDAGAGRDDPNAALVCYPFFSSHMSLPIKPGETVWYMYPNPAEPGLAYWMTRVCDKEQVEDANFTHHDRKHDDVLPPEEGEREPPSIHNGADPSPEEPDEAGHSLGDPLAYAKMRTESLEFNRFCIEPVPRIAKRPGDLVLQGSNNTAIILGTDRGFNVAERPDGTKALVDPGEGGDPLEMFKGTIDLVTGRGRLYGEETLEDLNDADPDGTRPRIIKNAEEDFESDKNPANHPDHGDKEKGAKVNLAIDLNEGDADFINDASRIYISTHTDVDANFGTTLVNIPAAYDKSGAEALVDAEDSATIAIKSDEIRIIARKTKDPDTEMKDIEYSDVSEINGSIRIIKEGGPKTDAACIYLLPDGTVQISGSKIMLGRSPETDEGTAVHEHDVVEVGKAEPYMRYTEFTEWAEGLIDAINTGFANAQDAINANGKACDMAGNMGASGGAGGAIPAPNGPLGGALSQLIAPDGASYDSGPDQDAIAEFKDTTSIRSERIFGE